MKKGRKNVNFTLPSTSSTFSTKEEAKRNARSVSIENAEKFYNSSAHKSGWLGK